jgi:hypothetical protein
VADQRLYWIDSREEAEEILFVTSMAKPPLPRIDGRTEV